jgi:gamma-glutamyltranspeptidase
MLQTLALLEGFDLASVDPIGADYAHVVTEAMKLAFADREAFYGDPDFTDVPMATLLSAAYNDARRALIGREANNDFRPGSPDGLAPRTDYAAAIARSGALAMAAGTGEPTVSRLGASGGDTCHIDVIDRWGNFVSATPSAGWLQSSPAIPGLGFCLGSRCQMFWLDESLPNGLKPGKRPRTTLSPSMVLRDGKPWMSFGTPGGEQQDQWQPIMFTRMVDHAMGIQQALAPCKDRIVLLQQIEIADRPRPHQRPEDDVVGVVRRATTDERLRPKHDPHRIKALAETFHRLVAIGDELLKRLADPRLARDAEVIRVLPIELPGDVETNQRKDAGDEIDIAPGIHELRVCTTALASKQRWPVRIGILKITGDCP